LKAQLFSDVGQRRFRSTANAPEKPASQCCIIAVCSEIRTKHKCSVWICDCESNHCRTDASRWHIPTDTTFSFFFLFYYSLSLSLSTLNQTQSVARPHIAIRGFVRVSEHSRDSGVTFRDPNRKNYHQDRSCRSHFLYVTSGTVLPNKGAEVTSPHPHGRRRFPANFTPDGTMTLFIAPNHILQLFSCAH